MKNAFPVFIRKQGIFLRCLRPYYPVYKVIEK